MLIAALRGRDVEFVAAENVDLVVEIVCVFLALLQQEQLILVERVHFVGLGKVELLI